VSDRLSRATSFGAAAGAYEQYRPGYTDSIADLALAGLGTISAVTGGPLRVLESGAGTGKATRIFAGRGLDLVAVEPDAQMRAVLHEVLARSVPRGRVVVVGSTLEELSPQWRSPAYDLVYAAASWHWVDQETRWERAAVLLRPGGVFASFGGDIDPEEVDLAKAVADLRPAVPPARAAGPEEPKAAHGELMHWPGSDLLASPFFNQVEEHRLPVSCEWPADDYVGLLSTVSAFRIIPASERQDRLARIKALLPDPVRVLHDVVLHRAVRTDLPARWPDNGPKTAKRQRA
jgi:SAM-dependent methyltransferase